MNPGSQLNIEERAALVGGNVSLRIMPLGASITFGDGSSTGNGYRQFIKTLLENDGNPVDMVGSRRGGSMEDNDNEGWPGAMISEVFEKAQLSVPTTLPNLVLINAGTNDCNQNNNITTAHERIRSILNYVWQASPRVSIVLSTLLPNGNEEVEDRVLTVNENIRSLVTELQGISKKVVLADMHTEQGVLAEDLVDGTHPDDAGYEKMAKIWLEAIKDAASRGWIQSPQKLP
jgi:lysophospholipase L1-like esterase